MSDIRFNRWLHQSGTGGIYQDASGRAGIGTDDPQEDLHIGSNSPYILLDDYDNNYKWKLKGTAWFAIEDTTAGVDRLRILSNGKIGIGTDNPEYNLDLGESPSTIRLVSENNGTAIRIGAGGNANQVTLLRVDGSNPGNKGTSNDSDFGFSVKYMGNRSGNNNSLSIFGDNQNGTTQVEAITINQDGSTGIGTDTPAEILTVAGNVRVQDSTDATQYLTINHQGVNFQNTGAGSSTTSSAHLLDDYEEGTWTPGIEGVATAGSYTFAGVGAYTKVGNKVTVWGQLLDITTVSVGSGNARITGLPFANALGFNAVGSILLDQWDLSSTAYIDVVAQIANSVNHMNPRIVRDGATDISLGITAKTNDNADIKFCITYTVA